MEKIIKSNRTSSYFIITMLLSILLFLLHILFPEAGEYSVSFTQLSPALGVAAIALILRDREIIKKIPEMFFVGKETVALMIPAIGIPLLLVAASGVILSLLNVQFVPWKGSFSFYALSTMAMLIGCSAEEIGWRGYLLPDLQKKHTPFISSIIVGILWGVWHLNFTGGILGFILYAITIIEMSVLMSWLFNKSSGNLVLMSLWHLTFNLASHYFLWERFGLKLFITEIIVFGGACILLAVKERDSYFFKWNLRERRLG